MLKKAVLVVFVLFAVSLILGNGFNVSQGKPYTLSPDPSANYPDDGTKLTDGSANFAWGDMVGFDSPATNPTIVIDLGDIYEEISYVALKLMFSQGSLVHLPEYFIVSISEDGMLFDDFGIGLVYKEAPVPNDTIATLYWVAPEFPGYGRYVKIEVVPGGTAWTMIAEAIVGNGDIPEEYGVEVPEFVDLEDAEIVSIGKPYLLIPIPSDAYPDTGSVQVTDGSAEYTWADMIGFDNPPINPTVIIDLLDKKPVVRVSGSFMRSYASTVNLPLSLLVSVSNDGIDFETVGLAVDTDPYPPMNESINEIFWVASEVVEARFVKIEIRPRGSAWTMLAEATVWAQGE